ncbi:MAG: hypothetical protein GWN93_06820 [Deltaproteobacteria bacterium]|nr:hypothetical protein [Deltaproteobacteria bacterium]
MLLSFLKAIILTVLNWLEARMNVPQERIDTRTDALTAHPAYLDLTESGPLGPFVAGR